MYIHLTLALCVASAALLVYRYDMYDREPWYMLLGTCVVGGLVMWALAHVEDATIDFLGVSPPSWALAAVASSHEELARLGIVLGVAFLARRHFNDPMDGIIYGSIAGIGMAASESISTLRRSPLDAPALPPVELVRLFSHLVLGGISGFAVGVRERSRESQRRWGRPLVACLGASLTIHFLWDWLVLTAPRTNPLDLLRTLGALGLLTGGTLLYGLLVVTASRWSRARHAPRQRELVNNVK